MQNCPQIICCSSDYQNGVKHTPMVMLSCIASVVPFCVWVVMQLPVRVAKGDTAFLHTFFLFFSIPAVSLLSCMAAAVDPVTVDEALQLLCPATVLGPCVVVCAGALPWRVHLANMIDITASVVAEVLNESLIANRLAVVFVSICTFFALVFLKAVFKAILRRGKMFQIFCATTSSAEVVSLAC